MPSEIKQPRRSAVNNKDKAIASLCWAASFVVTLGMFLALVL
jgi:hypothetical protein